MGGKRSCASSSRESIAMGQIARQPAEVTSCCDAPSSRRCNGRELCHKPAVVTHEACTSSSKGVTAGRVKEPWETGAPAFDAMSRAATFPPTGQSAAVHDRLRWVPVSSVARACASSPLSLAQSATATVLIGMRQRTVYDGGHGRRKNAVLVQGPTAIDDADRLVRLLCSPSQVCDEAFTFGRRRLIDSARHWLNGLTIPRIRSSP